MPPEYISLNNLVFVAECLAKHIFRSGYSKFCIDFESDSMCDWLNGRNHISSSKNIGLFTTPANIRHTFT